jgi:3-deoxy-D-manno-octulosonic acid (KDO) 8-phosphate synthase
MQPLPYQITNTFGKANLVSDILSTQIIHQIIPVVFQC